MQHGLLKQQGIEEEKTPQNRRVDNHQQKFVAPVPLHKRLTIEQILECEQKATRAIPALIAKHEAKIAELRREAKVREEKQLRTEQELNSIEKEYLILEKQKRLLELPGIIVAEQKQHEGLQADIEQRLRPQHDKIAREVQRLENKIQSQQHLIRAKELQLRIDALKKTVSDLQSSLKRDMTVIEEAIRAQIADAKAEITVCETSIRSEDLTALTSLVANRKKADLQRELQELQSTQAGKKTTAAELQSRLTHATQLRDQSQQRYLALVQESKDISSFLTSENRLPQKRTLDVAAQLQIKKQERDRVRQLYATREGETRAVYAAINQQHNEVAKLRAEIDLLEETHLVKNPRLDLLDLYEAISANLCGPLCDFELRHSRFQSPKARNCIAVIEEHVNAIMQDCLQVDVAIHFPELKEEGLTDAEIRKKYFQLCGLLDSVAQELDELKDAKLLAAIKRIRAKTSAVEEDSLREYQAFCATKTLTPLVSPEHLEREQKAYQKAYDDLMHPETGLLSRLKHFVDTHKVVKTSSRTRIGRFKERREISARLKDLYNSCKEVVATVQQTNDIKFGTKVLRKTANLLRKPDDALAREDYDKLMFQTRQGQGSLKKKLHGAMYMFFGCVLVAGSIAAKIVTLGLSSPFSTVTLVCGVTLFGAGASIYRDGKKKGFTKHIPKASRMAALLSNGAGTHDLNEWKQSLSAQKQALAKPAIKVNVTEEKQAFPTPATKDGLTEPLLEKSSSGSSHDSDGNASVYSDAGSVDSTILLEEDTATVASAPPLTPKP